MTTSDDDQAVEPTLIDLYWRERFGTAGVNCPLCRANDWFSPPEGPHSLEGQPEGVSFENDEPEHVGWAPPVGVWLRICGGCGFVAMMMREFVQEAEEKG